MLCQVSRADLPSLGICADALSVPPMVLGMSGAAFSIALVFMIFDLNMLSFFMRPCHAFPACRYRTGLQVAQISLSVCAMILAIV